MGEAGGLLHRAVGGDEDALTELLEKHGPGVERTLNIARQWRSVLEPADVMQVTYLEAFLQISRFDLRRSEPFEAWLGRIAANNLRDALRGLQRHKRPQPARRAQPVTGSDSMTELELLLGLATTTPSRYVTRDERMARLQFVLDTLPEDYARVIRLYDLEGLPIATVVSQMKRSPGAVHMLRARAHDSLREALGGESAWFSSSS